MVWNPSGVKTGASTEPSGFQHGAKQEKRSTRFTCNVTGLIGFMKGKTNEEENKWAGQKETKKRRTERIEKEEEKGRRKKPEHKRRGEWGQRGEEGEGGEGESSTELWLYAILNNKQTFERGVTSAILDLNARWIRSSKTLNLERLEGQSWKLAADSERFQSLAKMTRQWI